jgi:beta-phosphoglucomutase-like phosphatase (HAD superfamily)
MAGTQPRPFLSRPDTFLFDLGGVLVDDLDLNYATSIKIFEMLEKRHVTREEYVANLMPIQKLYKMVGLNEEESARGASRSSDDFCQKILIRSQFSLMQRPLFKY